MSDPTLSDNYLKNEMDWAWTTLKTGIMTSKPVWGCWKWPLGAAQSALLFSEVQKSASSANWTFIIKSSILKKRFGSVFFDLYFYTSKIILLSKFDTTNKVIVSTVWGTVQFLGKTNTTSSSMNFKRFIPTKMSLFEFSVLLGTEKITAICYYLR